MLRVSRLFIASGRAVVFIVLLSLSTFAQSNVSPIPLPQPFTPVIDNANVIDPDSRKQLEAIYKAVKERANIEFAVVTVPTTGDLDIYDYSLAVARGWGIGSKEGEKNAFLLLVAINDRKYQTMISRHLEGDLPDGVVGQIQRERLVPQFRSGNYSKGILDTVQSYVATLAQKRGFSVEGIGQSYAYQETPQGRRSNSRPQRSVLGSGCTVIIIIFVLILVFASNRRGGGGGGCLTALLLGNLLGGSGNRSGSGWGGGGFGGGGGGGGGFGGGFGGGGDFGGGGSGGSW